MGKCVALFVIELNQSKLFVIDPIDGGGGPQKPT